jgi:hypothetical protein
MELQADELLLLAAVEQATLKPDDAALRQARKILYNKHNLYCQADLRWGLTFCFKSESGTSRFFPI